MRQNKRKKGAAIETAILFMVLVFAMCTLITSMMFSLRVQGQRTAEKTNEEFALDQIGDYFIRALQQNNTINFCKDAFVLDEDGAPTTESIPENVRGGWILYKNGDVDYGLNLNTSSTTEDWNGVSTLRIARWEDVKTDGTLKSENDLLLIVTAKKSGSKIEITNWSDREVTGKKDVDPAKDLTAWERFVQFLRKLVELFAGLIGAVFGDRAGAVASAIGNGIVNIFEWLVT